MHPADSLLHPPLAAGVARVAKTRSGLLRLLLGLTLLVFLPTARAQTPAFQTLHQFDSTPTGVDRPNGLIQSSDGNFYGVSDRGGVHGEGMVFKLTPDGAETVLYTFGGSDGNGYQPVAGLVQGSDGAFYGSTEYGGNANGGVIFKITSGGSFTLLNDFDSINGVGGSDPFAPLIQAGDGNFYGTTALGGANGNGTVFKMTPDGTVTVLHSFSSTGNGTTNSDGALPFAALVEGADGNFYGTTDYGGSHGYGTIFKITPGGKLTPLHSFDGSKEGSASYGALVQGDDGNFYGTTQYGGPGSSGAAFQMTPGGTLTVLHAFSRTGSEGSIPYAGLTLARDGSFYGTTSAGGADGNGTVFKLTPGGAFTILSSFKPTEGNPSSREALVLGKDGNFYGAAPIGGPRGAGTAFQITPAGAVTDVQVFGGDGNHPRAALIQGKDGNSYGTTDTGGEYGKGAVFKRTPAGDVTILYSFGTFGSAGPLYSGTRPEAALVQGSDGNFYGTTAAGGDYGGGTAFYVSPDGELTALHDFGAGGSDGANPQAALVQGSDGDFYGTTAAGGSHGSGTFYKVTSNRVATTLHSFSATDSNGFNADGAAPLASLIQGSDGNFYGTTRSGGAKGDGTVFKITTRGAVTTLHSFGASAGDGRNPHAALILGGDGNFYGTTRSGGANGLGTVFQMTPGGEVAVIHSLSSAKGDGSSPLAPLYLSDDGNFYGTTSAGGDHGTGTVFQMSPDGALTTLHSFDALDGSGLNADGANPSGGIVEGTDGNFYGTAANGGTEGVGTLFSLVVPAVPVITSSKTPLGHRGSRSFSYRITASGVPTRYAATNLPPGTTLHRSTGLILGTPTTEGVYRMQVSATNSLGTGTATVTLTIEPPMPPTITSATTATGHVGSTSFSYRITATNSPTSYAATNLPPGTHLNTATGLISGTPTTEGTYTMKVSATNDTATGSATVTLTIEPAS